MKFWSSATRPATSSARATSGPSRLPWPRGSTRGPSSRPKAPISSSTTSQTSRQPSRSFSPADALTPHWPPRKMQAAQKDPAAGPFSGAGKARYLYAAALELVPAVDRGEHRGDALERAGVGQGARVHRARRRVAVRRPAQLDLGLRSQRLGLHARPVGVARADDDLVARLCPAEGEPRAFLAGAAEYADEHREGS